MQGTPAIRGALLALLATLALVACRPVDRQEANEQSTAAEQQSRQPEQRLRFEVVLSERVLRVFRDDQLIRTHDVAVGQPEWPTPTGAWSIHRVDWNPDWVPPDSEWAADREPKPPGHPDNPMGRARLVFDMPYTIHGTDDLASLGTNESHGSIRVANEAVTQLARLLMEEGGEPRDEAWYQRVIDTPDEMVQVELPNPVPITVRD